MRTPRPPRPPPTPEDRAERRSRALEEVLDVRRVQGPPGVLTLEVRNPRRHSHYTLYIPAYPDRTGSYCGCVDFARRDLGTCKHIEAAWLWLSDHPDETEAPGAPTPSPGWASIEKRSRHPKQDGPASARIRYVGELLLA
ncbi:MAG: hypothetical protein L3K00_08670 [Thermoplasmata archaeon]|nr:hypothetical protein [Thermoplasmata archaeon]